ncbi:hypothetical protein Pse7367_1723 [Thalassoporum mexicanum PCC 7367]|nr:hypothetical protein Pse7367_1723 [Pseudanabaena sp. PCC 7367]
MQVNEFRRTLREFFELFEIDTDAIYLTYHGKPVMVAIADYLNRNNYPTKRGGNWTYRTVKLILDRTKVKSA